MTARDSVLRRVKCWNTAEPREHSAVRQMPARPSCSRYTSRVGRARDKTGRRCSHRGGGGDWGPAVGTGSLFGVKRNVLRRWWILSLPGRCPRWLPPHLRVGGWASPVSLATSDPCSVPAPPLCCPLAVDASSGSNPGRPTVSPTCCSPSLRRHERSRPSPRCTWTLSLEHLGSRWGCSPARLGARRFGGRRGSWGRWLVPGWPPLGQ